MGSLDAKDAQYVECPDDAVLEPIGDEDLKDAPAEHQRANKDHAIRQDQQHGAARGRAFDLDEPLMEPMRAHRPIVSALEVGVDTWLLVTQIRACSILKGESLPGLNLAISRTNSTPQSDRSGSRGDSPDWVSGGRDGRYQALMLGRLQLRSSANSADSRRRPARSDRAGLEREWRR